MSTPHQANSSTQPSDPNLPLLYAEQRSLLERLSIHQRNLHELLRQKALHRITVPLSIINGIAHEEASINDVEKDLTPVNQQIDKVISKSAKLPEQLDRPFTSLNIDNVDYLIEFPYPALDTHTTLSPRGEMLSTFRFAGGFEMRSTMQPNGSMTVSFFRHGRQVVPQIDQANKKIIIPVGRAITVNQFALSTNSVETIYEIPSQRIDEGCWTVLAPSQPIETINYFEWPQGYKDYIITTKITYSSGHELWMVKTLDVTSFTLWFYLDNWHIVPDIDHEHLSLTFPPFGSNPVKE